MHACTCPCAIQINLCALPLFDLCPNLLFLAIAPRTAHCAGLPRCAVLLDAVRACATAGVCEPGSVRNIGTLICELLNMHKRKVSYRDTNLKLIQSARFTRAFHP